MEQPKYLYNDQLIDRVKTSSFLGRFKDDAFAQNFYAAFCNNEFDVDGGPTIASYSWRTSGGIVAEIRDLVGISGEDYLDWYCSGMSSVEGFVHEDCVTDEIRDCLKEIGLIINERSFE
jgi:hypothetical protein